MDNATTTESLARVSWRLFRHNRDFRLFFTAQLISSAGDWFLIVALSGLVLKLTDSPGLAAAVFVAYSLPYAFATFVGGPLADRLDRRRLMIVTNLVMGLLAVGFFLVRDRADLWLLYVLAAGISAVSALFEPAASASVPNLVDPEDLGAANALTGAAWGVMMAVGAAAGGLVVAAYGVHAGYTVDAASFAIAAVLVWLIRRPTSRPREPHVEHPGLISATREAMAYARRDHRVLVLFAARLGMGTAIGLVALLPVIAINVLHAGDRGTGILFAFRGVGFLIGPFLIRSVIKRRDRRRLYTVVIAGPAVFAAMYAITPWMSAVLTAGLILLVGNMVLGAQWALTTFAYQSIVPDRVLGRIFGFDGALITVTMAASNAIAGLLAVTLGIRWAVAIIASAVVVWMGVVWVLASAVRSGPAELPAVHIPGGPQPGETSRPAI
jgi:MFS family permease